MPGTAKYYRDILDTVPLPRTIVDARLESVITSLEQHDPSFAREIRRGRAAARNMIELNLAEELRLTIFSLGIRFYELERGPEAEQKREITLTEGRVFVPAVALVIARATGVPDPNATVLGHVYDWYASCLRRLPQKFRTDQWQLLLTENSELMIRLTNEAVDAPLLHQEEQSEVRFERK